MIDKNYIENWIKKAEEDLKTASHELLLSDNEMVTSSICFHSQQAAEKYLKCFLVFKNIEFSRTHDIELLQEFCGRVDDSFYEAVNIKNFVLEKIGG